MPPLAKEYASLELERMLEKAREADAVLQPTRRQVGELERELEREERARRRDEGLLRDLVRNARGQEEVRREKRKTVCLFSACHVRVRMDGWMGANGKWLVAEVFEGGAGGPE